MIQYNSTFWPGLTHMAQVLQFLIVIHISVYYKHAQLCNLLLTFVLGFSNRLLS